MRTNILVKLMMYKLIMILTSSMLPKNITTAMKMHSWKITMSLIFIVRVKLLKKALRLHLQKPRKINSFKFNTEYRLYKSDLVIVIRMIIIDGISINLDYIYIKNNI